jgi:type I restriction enzyme S subunit
MNGKQLKNSILQWAIQGKLVPQDPNDEPASALLERIRAEKARLVKEKKIKKDKNESIIYRGEDNSYYEKFLATGEVKCIDEEIPFDLPLGWEWCRMGSIGDWGAGATPAKGNSDYYGGNILWLRTGELNNGVVYDTEIKITEKALQECSLRLNKAGDVLIAMYGATIGKVAIAGNEMTSNQACCACTPFGVFNYYLFYYLMGSQMDFIKKGEGGAQPNISREKLISHLMPIPPLKEQYRIVEQIQKILPLIEIYSASQDTQDKLNAEINEKLKKSILQEAIQGKLVPQIEEEGTTQELLEQIKQEKQKLVKEGKLMKSALTDSVIFKGDDNKYYEQIGKEIKEITEEILFDLPNKWQWCRIGTIFMHNNGKQLNKGNSKGKLMKYITTSNLYWDGFVLDNLKEMPFEENEIERCMAVKGDLLVCEGGDIGRACLWNYDFPIMLQNHIHKLRSYIPICTKFFYYIFNLYKLTGLIGGKGIGIKGFSSKALHNTLMPLPPLKEQQRIVTQIEKLFEQLR